MLRSPGRYPHLFKVTTHSHQLSRRLGKADKNAFVYLSTKFRANHYRSRGACVSRLGGGSSYDWIRHLNQEVIVLPWMRKIVLLMLLALFPLQSSWAVVSTSCSHEDGSAANHLGHHEHPHESLGTDEEGSSKAAKKSVWMGLCLSWRPYQAAYNERDLSWSVLSMSFETVSFC